MYTTRSDLPNPGDGFEMQLLDFKATSSGVAPFHLAKDVAALANHLGGSIIVGAREVSGTLAHYAPLETADAAAQQRAYEEAVRDLCSPPPMYGVERIAVDGGLVLAVNVEPAVNALVGVRVTAVKEDVGWGGRAWIFPMRTGSQTRLVEPSELPMFTTGHVRRMAVLLSSIADDETLTVVEETKFEGGRAELICKVLVVDEASNAVQLQVTSGSSALRTTRPLEAFQMVWRESAMKWRAFLSLSR